MSTPSLKPALPAGSILTQNVDSDFADFVAGRPVTQRLLISVVQVGAITSGNKDVGRVNTNKYEVIHAVEITDPHEQDTLRHRLTQLRAERGFLARQPALFDASDEEKRESLIDMIRDWASEQDIPMTDVDARFLDYFGGAENATSESVQACKSVAQLSEFAYAQGVLAETTDEPSVEDPPFSDDGDDPSDDNEPDDDTTDNAASTKKTT